MPQHGNIYGYILCMFLGVASVSSLHAQDPGNTPQGATPTAASPAATVDSYTPEQLRKMGAELAAKATTTGSAAETLVKYPGHYTMLSYRNQSGTAELHQHFADIFVIVEGSATLQSGGTIVTPQTSSPGEIRGASLDNPATRSVHAGDVVHIPAGVPHLLSLDKGAHLLYFVVKVQESAP